MVMTDGQIYLTLVTYLNLRLIVEDWDRVYLPLSTQARQWGRAEMRNYP